MGKEHGYFKIFDEETGKIEAEGEYVNGERKGVWKYYKKNGSFKVKKH
ncbi:MAG: hypothetical protein SNJ77_05910 [Cytophagales bacterium]